MKRSPEWYAQYAAKLRARNDPKRWGDNIEPAALLESEVMPAVLKTLQFHPRVAWAYRFNTGAMEIDGRYISFAFKGCADILGQMKDGRFLAVECKRPGKRATSDQAAFLETVNRNGGVGFVATGVDDVLRELSQAKAAA